MLSKIIYRATISQRPRLTLASLLLVTPIVVNAEPGAQLQLEEVVVTARKRVESLQDVGVSVNAFSSDEIRSLKIDSSVEIAHYTPNLNISQAFANSVPQIFIRGVGLKDPNANANGAVGVYVDEVNLVSPMALTFQLFDIERVEVLKGPQGTLYGRNTTGGAVKFISSKPTDLLEGFAGVDIGNYSSRSIKGAVSGPLFGDIRGRLSGIYSRADGFHENRITGHDLADTDAGAIRLLLDWSPNDQFYGLLNVHGGRTDTSSVPFEHSGRVDASGAPCDPRGSQCSDFLGYRDGDDDPYEHDLDFEGATEIDNQGASLELNWQIHSRLSLVSISAYEDSSRKHREDADASPSNVLNTYWDDENEQYSQEFRLVSDSDTNVNWIAGLFYSEEKNSIGNQYDFFRGFREIVEAENPEIYPGGFDPDGTNSLGVTPFYVDQRFYQEASSLALFGNVQWRFTDTIELELGLRYTDEDREMQQNTSFVEPTFQIPLVPDYSDSTSFDNVSWKAGFTYTPTDAVMFYGNVSTGFKSGGYNGALVFDTSALEPFEEETLTSYEVGLKSTLFEGRARFNAAVFYYSYDDMQLFTFASVGGLPVQVLDNAGESTLYGLDAELDVRLSESFDARFALGMLHTELDEYKTALPGADLSGNELVLSPDLSFNTRLRYRWPLTNGGELIAQTDASYQDDFFLTPDNNELLAQDSYWLWNGRLGYSAPEGRWEVAAWIKNITDEEYLVEAYDFSSNGWDLLIYGMPRTYGIEFTAYFN